MIFALLSCVYILVVNFSFIIYFDKKFSSTLFPTIIYSSFILMFFGFFNHLNYGLWFGFFVSSIYILYTYIKNKNFIINQFNNNFLSIGLIVYLLLFIYTLILQSKNGLSHYDEFTLWGTRVVEMLKYNSIRNINSKYLYPVTTYPMFLGCLESLFCLLNGSFEENICYIAITIYYFAIFGQLFENLKINKFFDWTKAILIVLSILVLGTSITTYEAKSIYDSLYSDYLLGITAAYCFFQVYKYNFKKDKFRIFTIVASSLALCFIKQIGVVYFIIIIMYLLFKYLYYKKISPKKAFLYIISSILISATLLIVIDKFLFNFLDFNNIKMIISFCFNENLWQHEIFTKYVSTLFFEKTTPGIFHLSFFLYVAIICLAIFLYLYFKYTNIKKSILLPMSLFLGSIIYSASQLFFYYYLANFEIYEGNIILPSYGRYLGCYLYLILLLSYIIIIDKTDNICLYIIFSLSCLLTTNKDPLNQILSPSQSLIGLEDNEIYDYSNKLLNLEANSSILIIEQYNYPAYKRHLYCDLYFASRYDYNITPIQLGKEGHSWHQPQDLSVSEYLELLNNYDYLYLVFPDDIFINDYWNVTTDSPLYNGAIYKISKIENNKALLDIVCY